MVDEFGGVERRRFKRLKVQLSVTYMVQKPLKILMRVGDKKIETVMLDISEEGMSIKAAVDIPLETEFVLNFLLVYAYKPLENIMQNMEIEGRVVNRVVLNQNDFRLGILFTKISEIDRKLITDFIKVSSKG